MRRKPVTEREIERERETEGVKERIMDINAGCKRVGFRRRTMCQEGNDLFWENEKKGLLIVPQFIW
jgi:hypothetical protein